MRPPYKNSAPKGFPTTPRPAVLHLCWEDPGPQLPVLMFMPVLSRAADNPRESN